ncbi:MAG: putative two-component histidine kinase, partial [Acidimicrobiia bacterium]|nr:putative two-component histidine kinase [Acidimicrobiia bacterium]
MVLPHWIRRLRPKPLGLRARITLSFALGAALLSIVLASTTYVVTSRTLVRQRESVLLRQAYLNANQTLDAFGSTGANILTKLQNLPLAGSKPVVVYQDRVTPLDADVGIDAVPAQLRERAAANVPARMRFRLNGKPWLGVAIPIPASRAVYYELTNLQELNKTLRSLAAVLVGASLLTTASGILVGMWASGRAVRPLAQAARAAEAIAGGRLDTRLEPVDDPDLRALTNAFNDMASALEMRVERDARFASDVSHELRSPLMTLSASAEVLQSRRDELPERAAVALDLLVGDVARFQGLVADLLEISRFDAGAVHLNLEELLVGEFVANAVRASDAGEGVSVVIDEDAADAIIRADKRRLAQVVANLLDNARFYGGGATSVSVQLPEGPSPETVLIAVEDAGPGVPTEERSLI